MFLRKGIFGKQYFQPKRRQNCYLHYNINFLKIGNLIINWLLLPYATFRSARLSHHVNPWSIVLSFKLRFKLKNEFLICKKDVQVQHKTFFSVKLRKVKFKSYGLDQWQSSNFQIQTKLIFCLRQRSFDCFTFTNSVQFSWNIHVIVYIKFIIYGKLICMVSVW